MKSFNIMLMIYFVMILSVFFTTFGNFFQKLAADNKPDSIIETILQPITLLAFFMMGVGALIWLYVLSKVPVSTAYPFVSLSFVFILLLSKFILKEKVPLRRWGGVLFIIVGVVMVAGG